MENIPKEIYEKSLIEVEKSLFPYKIYYDIITKWFMNKLEGHGIESKLIKNNIHNIVIYGMGNLGQLLYKELENSSVININYTLDKNIDNEKIKKYKALKETEIDYRQKIDAIIITPIYASEPIKEYLNTLYTNRSTKLILIDELINDEGV